ncbi:hypothetical protein OF83DRAFT_756856 [Amylostereum chailletii]|nr:hypothetical protein OF83DRAFT_756856 [Amylostereum chailletii]
MSSNNSYLQALIDVLPKDCKAACDALQASCHRDLTETIIRLAVGGPCPSAATPQTRASWSDLQSSARASFQTLTAKRKRSASPPPTPSKKARLPSSALPEDAPRSTLHALSVSAPLRKKLDVTVCEHTLKLTHPTTHAVEASFPLHALKRVFLLPTRGKSKPHWTVVLMSSDVAPRAVKGNAPDPEQYQIIFGMDAEPTTSFSTSIHPSPPQTHSKGTPTRELLLEFLKQLPCTVTEPSAAAFRSATSGVPGVAAYRGAKEGTLWFLKEGIFGETRPCEFWALKDLNAGDEGDVGGAVRTLSATGRMGSVFITRRASPANGEDQEEGEETEFSMVEGRELENIKEWVRKFKSAFGKVSAGVDKGKGKAVVVANGKGKENGQEEGDDVMMDSDESDSDFEVSSGEYDGGSPSSDSDSSDEEGGSGGGGGQEGGAEDSGSDEEEADESGAESGQESEGEEDLDPKHHPLLRPGAMPKMSRAAMDAAVGIVLHDLTGEQSEEDELDD